MICFPNAKINLGLHILSKRSDGYHNIETIFYPIHLCDALEIVPAPEGKGVFTQTGIPIAGKPEDNIVMKAYTILKEDYNLPKVSIFLRKQIPVGAGLGGGSSNAAFMIKLLNDYAELKLSINQMEAYAAQLGADCPFFIQNVPVFAEGTGTFFSPIAISLQEYQLVVVKPAVFVSTKEAYHRIRPHQPKVPLKDIIRLPINEWKDHLVNDFESEVFIRFPEIKDVKQKLYAAGALYASMSGSGSAVFGIFDKSVELNRLTIKEQIMYV